MILINFIRLVRQVRSRRQFGVMLPLCVLLLCLLGNAITFYVYDRPVQSGLTFGDALWYSIISITTIGYGDYSAQSTGARLGTIVFIVLIGLSAFSVLFGVLLDNLASHIVNGKKGLRNAMANDHVLIVNFPNETRIRQIIDELTCEQHKATEIVIISDQIEELPFELPNVLFVRGSIHDIETYKRARADRARMAIILSRDYNDANSDAINAAAAGVIDKLCGEVHIVAECIDLRHRALFNAVRCNAIVPGPSIAGNLLVQEVQDPGISRLVEVITSNRIGATLYSTRVEAQGDKSYTDLVADLLKRGINVLAYARAEEVVTSFDTNRPQTGDRILYIAEERQNWSQLTQHPVS